VALFKKGLREELTFWSAKELLIGTIVSVPVRSRYVLGMIIKCEPLALQKSDIKSAPFKLKKITSIRGHLPHAENLVNEIIEFGKEYAVPISEILGYTIGEEGVEILLNYEPESLSQKSITYIHEPRETRLILYKRLVREALSGKKLIIIAVPTKAIGRKIFETISPGIEKHLILGLESGQGASKLFKEFCGAGKSVCLIANIKNAFALMPFADVLIIDDCGSRFYTNNKRPHIPYNELIIKVSMASKTKTIIAGSYLNINQYLLAKNKTILPNRESNTRFLIDNHKISFSFRDKNNWELFTAEAKKVIERSNEERTFIFSPKSGLFPITICGDCKSPLTCDICHAPMRLIEKNGKKNESQNSEREFVCPRCKNNMPADTKCPKCTSWNLRPFGIGSERIVEAIKTNYPEIKIFYLNEDSGITEIKKTLKLWNESSGVLVGPERILNKITDYPENIIIASIDSLFGIPNYRISEKIFEIILNANDCTTKKLHIITGLKDEYLFSEIKRGNLKMFYEDELSDRKDLNFPPYGYLLNIKKSVNQNDIIRTKKLLREIDKNIEISAYTKTGVQTVLIAKALYDTKTWTETIAPKINQITDQSFDIYINETDWLN
jgi:primosomal protein N' (replication factor Y)